jgi:hypothetical protein
MLVKLEVVIDVNGHNRRSPMGPASPENEDYELAWVSHGRRNNILKSYKWSFTSK